MIIIQINPNDLENEFNRSLTRDECCEALVGERAFIENDIIIADAPERGPKAFDIILGKGEFEHQLDLTLSFDVDHVRTEEES